MTHRRTHDLPAWSVCLVLATAACAASAPRAPSPMFQSARLTPMARYFDASQIQSSGAATAWDALRFLAPLQRIVEDGPLGSRRTPMTSGSGVMGLPAPRILLDGFPVSDLSSLRAIRASDLIDIQLLGSVDAVMLFGPSYGGGVIVVRTVHRLVRQDR